MRKGWHIQEAANHSTWIPESLRRQVVVSDTLRLPARDLEILPIRDTVCAIYSWGDWDETSGAATYARTKVNFRPGTQRAHVNATKTNGETRGLHEGASHRHTGVIESEWTVSAN